jgi:hypothetical protein
MRACTRPQVQCTISRCINGRSAGIAAGASADFLGAPPASRLLNCATHMATSPMPEPHCGYAPALLR